MNRYRFYIPGTIPGAVLSSGTCTESQIPSLRDEAADYSNAELVLVSIH